MARPSIYTEELLKKASDYAAKAAIAIEGASMRCPSVAELALTLGVARSSLYIWANEHPEFSDILEKILAIQELQLIDNGLSGKYAATITKLMLTKHGYTDKTDVTSDDKPLQPLLVRFIGDGPDNRNPEGV